MSLNYEIRNKIEALSSGIKSLVQPQNTYINYKVQSDNLRYNLANILADILFELNIPDTSLTTFKKHVERYNSISNTNLSVDNFTDNCWVRIVSNKISISDSIKYYLWNIGYSETSGKTVQIVEGTDDLTNCLRSYYKEYIEDKRPFILKDRFEDILNNYPTENSLLKELINESGFLKFNENNNSYIWYGENSNQLSNEIGALLWMKFNSISGEFEDFSKYIDLLNASNLIVWDLSKILMPSSQSKIFEYSIKYLEGEQDLNKTEKEVDKIFLDSEESRRSIEYINNVPDILLDYSNPLNFILSITNAFWSYAEISFYQSTRSYTFNLVRFIYSCHPSREKHFESFLSLAKNLEKPYLVWYLYNDIPKSFPEVIPYMITEDDLAPLVFKFIDEIEINHDFTKGLFHVNKLEYELKRINLLIFEIFDLLLEFFSGQKELKNKGFVLSNILMNLSKDVFSSSLNNDVGRLKHNYKLQRYHYFVKELNNKRTDPRNIYPAPIINDKLFHALQNEVVEYVNNLPEERNLQYLLGRIDLIIEFIRIANTYKTETNHNDEKVNSLINSKNNLITACLKNVRFLFEKISNSFNGFAFEIIDWAYLYLNLQEIRQIDLLHNEFLNSIEFNTQKDKYDSKNENQTQKIRYYLKSILIAHNQISNNPDNYKIAKLPTNTLQRKLEEWIIEISEKHSIYDFKNKRTDIFDERFNLFGNYLYHSSLTNLLHKCINNFRDEEVLKFIANLYSKNENLEQLLTAINNLKSIELKDYISKRIKSISVEDFINSRFTVTELKLALIEAINSEKHWELSKPLIKRVKKHADSREKLYNSDTYYFLFEISLLLFFKEKDFSNLRDINIPEANKLSNGDKGKYEMMKQFYIAIHYVYNERKYNEGINLLLGLHTQEPKDIRYAYHLFKARTLKALQDG